jgi:hypothetical protein
MQKGSFVLGSGIAATFAAVACGASPAPSAPGTPPAAATESAGAAAQPPPKAMDFETASHREVPPGPTKPVSSGALAGEVEAIATPQVTHPTATTTQVEFSIAPDVSFDCFLYANPIDAGGVLATVVASLTKNGYVIGHAAPTNVVLVGDDPAIFIEAPYTATQTDGTSVTGAIKAMVVSSMVKPMMCLLDGVGYAATFDRVTTGLASSLKPVGAPPPGPKYVSVAIERLDGHPTGFSKDLAVDEDNGKITFVSISASVKPGAQGLLTVDTAEAQTWDGHGGIAEAHYTSASNDGAGASIDLKRVGTREYEYKGSLQGKETSGRFKTKNPKGLRAETENHAALKRLVEGGKADAKVTYERYSADVDPSAPHEEVYQVVSKADRSVSMNLGPIKVLQVLDEQGKPKTGSGTVNGVALTYERVLIRGAP